MVAIGLVVISVSGETLVTVQDVREDWLPDQVIELLPTVADGHEYSLLCGKARWAKGKPLSLVLPKGRDGETQHNITAVVTDQKVQEELNMQLLTAASELDVDRVRSLLESGASAAFVHDPPGTWGAKDEKSALHLAIQSRNKSSEGGSDRRDAVIELLLEARADPNAVRKYSDWRGCGSSSTAFEMVLGNVMERPDKLQRWLDAGANPNTWSVQDVHSMRTDGRAAKAVLHTAASAQNLDVARTLLDAGAEVDAVETEDFNNERGYNRHMKQTALHIACSEGDVAMAALMLSRGADVNKVREDLEQVHVETSCTTDDPREEGYESPVRCLRIAETALHRAVLRRHPAVVALLICAGANVGRSRLRDGEESSVEDLCAGDASLLQALEAKWPDAKSFFSEDVLPGVVAAMEARA